MAAVTLSTLRTRVRTRANMENTQFVTDANLLTFINQSYRHVFDLLLQSHSDYFSALSSTFALTTSAPSQDLSSLVTRFYKLRDVERQNGDRWFSVPRGEFRERNSQVNLSYVLVANTLYLYPVQSCAGTYRVWAIAEPVELSADGDTISLPNGAEELVVLQAAIKCLAKEESDTTDLRRDYETELKRVLDSAYDADAANPPRVTDVRRDALFWDDYTFLP